MPLQSFVRVGCLRKSNGMTRRWQRIGSSRCSSAAFWVLMPRIPAAEQAHARVRARARATRARAARPRRGRGKGAHWGHRAVEQRSHDSANSPETERAACARMRRRRPPRRRRGRRRPRARRVPARQRVRGAGQRL